MAKKKDITWQRFGKLKALYELEERKNGHTQWHCICDCGTEVDIVSYELMNAVINSDKSYEEILAFVQGKEVE